MNKNNFKKILVVAIVVLIGAALLYKDFGGKSSNASFAETSSAVAGDPMHNNGTTNISSTVLNGLVDKQVPVFSFADRDGNIYSFDNLRGKKFVLFFTEGLMCYPACWNQITSFAKDTRFKNADALVLSVVVDSKDEWQQAVNKMPELAQATVVFDKDSTASKQFGMLSAPSSMHPGSLPGHTYAVVDQQGVIRSVIDDPSMSINNDKVFAEVQKLN